MISKHTINRLEANFWSGMISLLDQSSAARKVTPEIYKLINDNQDFVWLGTGVLLAVIGLVIGYATGSFLRYF